jgi:eukaryotic-like serine/threonine-protein kinase
VMAAALSMLILIGVIAYYTLRLTHARNEAVAEAARTQRIQQFMMQLFEGGDSEFGPAEDLRVTTLVDRGLQSAKALDATPAIQAELYLTLGSIYEQLGDLDQAESLFNLAAERRRELFGTESAEYAEVLIAQGQLRIVQARLEQAEPLVREGLAMSRRVLPRDHPQVARAAATLGMLLQEKGEYDTAIEVLEQAVKLQSAAVEPGPELSTTLGVLANTYFYAGRLEESEALNQRTLELDRKLWGERHPNVADALINLGAIRFNSGRYEEAESYDRQALAMIEAWYGREHPETASAMTVLGRALVYQQKLDEANRLLEQALEIQQRFHGELHPLVSSIVNDLANAAVLCGDLDRAEALYRRTAESARAIYGERHQRVALALANLASVDLAREEFAKAEAGFRDVVSRYSEALSPEDLQTGIARIKLGRALVGQSRFAEAEIESLAGYRIVSSLSDPTVGWLRSARSDLATIYDALGRPGEADRFRDEQASLDSQ